MDKHTGYSWIHMVSEFSFPFEQDGDEPFVYKAVADLVQVPDPEIDMVC